MTACRNSALPAMPAIILTLIEDLPLRFDLLGPFAFILSCGRVCRAYAFILPFDGKGVMKSPLLPLRGSLGRKSGLSPRARLRGPETPAVPVSRVLRLKAFPYPDRCVGRLKPRVAPSYRQWSADVLALPLVDFRSAQPGL